MGDGGLHFRKFRLVVSQNIRYICNFVAQVVSKLMFNLSMFFIVFIDISLTLVQLGLKNFGKIITPFYYPRDNKLSLK